MTLSEALAVLAPSIPDGTVCVHANGYIGRAGCAARDRDECFYMIGSMGLASSIGLGVALAQPRRRVLVLIALGPPGPPAQRIPHTPEAMVARLRRALGTER